MNGNSENGGNLPALDTSNQEVASTKDTLDILSEMSAILKTGLDGESLAITYRLVENGINPQTLAQVVNKLRTEDGGSNSKVAGSKF